MGVRRLNTLPFVSLRTIHSSPTNLQTYAQHHNPVSTIKRQHRLSPNLFIRTCTRSHHSTSRNIYTSGPGFGRTMAPLTTTTHTYATHDVPLKCDVYEADDYPSNSPVFLFFHSGGLVTGSRLDVHPWTVQMCLRNKWPIVSVSHRLLPHVSGKGLLDDAKAAYEFARNLGGGERQIIIGGASAGFWMTCILTAKLETKPLALFSITGLPTFRHKFYSSSTILDPNPIQKEDADRLHAGPISTDNGPRQVFDLDMLTPDGSKNPHFDISSQIETDETRPILPRTTLYSYYVRNNLFLSLIGEVDGGFEWAKDPSQADRLAEWPVTVFIQGSADEAVDMDICAGAADALGADKAKFFLAKDELHLFEADNFIEDPGYGMDVVRQAIQALEKAVSDAQSRH